RGPELVTRLGAGIVIVAFAAMALSPLLHPHAQLGLLVASAIGFDLGVQAALIAHQTIVYGIDPGARSRLNAVMFTGIFIGMAIGSALGALVLSQWGWMGVTVLATVAAVGALAVRLWPAAVTE
ncbi:MAG: MFS transporter, partial [Hyphomicrobiales bacterium]